MYLYLISFLDFEMTYLDYLNSPQAKQEITDLIWSISLLLVIFFIAKPLSEPILVYC